MRRFLIESTEAGIEEIRSIKEGQMLAAVAAILSVKTGDLGEWSETNFTSHGIHYKAEKGVPVAYDLVGKRELWKNSISDGYSAEKFLLRGPYFLVLLRTNTWANSTSLVACLNAKNGSTRWIEPVTAGIPDIEATDSTLYTFTTDNELAALEIGSGNARWRIPCSVKSHFIGSVSLDHGRLTVAPGHVLVDNGSQAKCFDAKDGRLKWERRGAVDENPSVMATNKGVLLNYDGILEFVSLDYGLRLWKIMPDQRPHLLFESGAFWMGLGGNKLSMIDPRTGEIGPTRVLAGVSSDTWWRQYWTEGESRFTALGSDNGSNKYEFDFRTKSINSSTN